MPYRINVIKPPNSDEILSRKSKRAKPLNKTNQFIIVNGALRISTLFLRSGWKKLKSNLER
jgi:hypothetical protein